MATDNEHAGTNHPAAAAELQQVASDELQRVERAATALSPVERDVLALSAGHRLSNADIAARLGIGERRAERILARALRKFCRAMNKDPRRRWRRLW